ncbi:MAG: bifunctional phosphopantothenoylcysteine decarboxylase/phosphopantothenate--cysteine ligase CoaBC [Acidobacteria bacterium]|nr:bifunctional phosphopantothenoylcysteine decarboxylase/phosphopantothenate--cysteine ligase CoaBC [Acidobacteriota bacterium]
MNAGPAVTSKSLAGKHVVLAVTGGIAAYKACEIVRRLRDHGLDVRVAMTRAATRFVGPVTFAALSGNPVITSLFDDGNPEDVPHVRWAEWADLFCVAPATADFVAKMAHGVADDFASTLYLANAADTLVAPAMEDDMYRHPAVQRNLDRLLGDGVGIVGPNTGALASGRQGPGRMSEPGEVVQAATRALRFGVLPRDLTGQRVLITAGPTYEAADPARGLTNRSSGRMGFALAQEAIHRGASVKLVAGPVSLATPAGVERIDVVGAAAMFERVEEHVMRTDIAIMCAAVADFAPVNPSGEKLKKDNDDGLVLSLERTVDILRTVADRDPRPYLVGFAAESDDVAERAARKLADKGCDLIVANTIGGPADAMGGENNSVAIIDSRGQVAQFGRAPKDVIATQIWAEILRARSAGVHE